MVDGLPGDIVALALPLDVQKIVEAGLINPDWEVRPCITLTVYPPSSYTMSRLDTMPGLALDC